MLGRKPKGDVKITASSSASGRNSSSAANKKRKWQESESDDGEREGVTTAELDAWKQTFAEEEKQEKREREKEERRRAKSEKRRREKEEKEEQQRLEKEAQAVKATEEEAEAERRRQEEFNRKPGINGGNPNGLPCKHWEQGKCNVAICNFSHEGPGSPSPMALNFGPYAAKPKGQGRGKCNQFAETGTCIHGAACRFAHVGAVAPAASSGNVGMLGTGVGSAASSMPGTGAGLAATSMLGTATDSTATVLLGMGVGAAATSMLGTGAGPAVIAGGGSGPGAMAGQPVGSPCKYFALGKCNFPDCKFSHEGPGSVSPLGMFIR
eukprot:TRINITY_DN77645_c0_g1_i1.p1 TRINITY_DN77645_c0_g1~~TRINITY_DN77645_c0_g1_i1.p1  ORF type:complete len:323 (+),score=63.22 TRINITY_DN77645_c0_g1_i1:80-1048(+)